MTSQGFRDLIDFLKQRGPSTNGDPDMTELRERVVALNARFFDPPEHTFDEVDLDGIPAAWVRSPHAEIGRVVLYFHGGGYGAGSVHTHRDLTARVSLAARAEVLSVDYRLAPEHQFPAAVDDGLGAYRWLLGPGGFSPSQVAFSGDSAGGGLALGVALAARDCGDPLPACVAPISPMADMSHSGASVVDRADRDPLVSPKGSHAYAMRYVRSWHDFRNPYASPVYADFTGMPPIRLMAASEDVLFDDATRIAASIERVGGNAELVVGEGMVHNWPMFASSVPEGQEAIDGLGSFVLERTSAASK